MNVWHIITPELPPGCGGVGEYSAQVAIGLAEAGHGPVTVWSPATRAMWTGAPGVEVQPLPDRFGPRAIRLLERSLDAAPSNASVLVQYVPNVFGRRGTNLSFCRWLRQRRGRGQNIRVMFHEPYLYFRWRPDHFAIALTQRLMAATMLRAASQVYVSTEAWRRYLSPYGRLANEATDLPIPSAIPCVDDARAVATRRARVGGEGPIVGHFGSYGDHVAPLLARALRAILANDPAVTAICAGDGSDGFVADLVRRAPALQGRVYGPGRAALTDISIDLQACDVVIQPYPDGVTTRRTSLMAALANGRPVVTTDGDLTEDLWRATGAVALAPAGDGAALEELAIRLLRDKAEREALARRGRELYMERFDLHRTIETLTAPLGTHV